MSNKTTKRMFDGLIVATGSARRFAVCEPAWWQFWRWAAIGVAKLLGTPLGTITITNLDGEKVTVRVLPVKR